MSSSARAYRKAAAGPEGEICFFLGRAGRDLKSLIGDSADEELFFVPVESEGLVGHGIDPFLANRLRLMGRTSVGSLGLPEPFQSFRLGFCLAEWEMIVATNRQVIRAEGETTPFGDTSRYSDPAGPVHIRVGHGCLQ